MRTVGVCTGAATLGFVGLIAAVAMIGLKIGEIVPRVWTSVARLAL